MSGDQEIIIKDLEYQLQYMESFSKNKISDIGRKMSSF